MPPDVALLNEVAFAILGLSFFHTKLIIVLSRSVKNCAGILMWDWMESVDCFWQDCHFYYVDPTYPRAWEIFPFSGIFCSCDIGLSLVWLVLPQGILCCV